MMTLLHHIRRFWGLHPGWFALAAALALSIIGVLAIDTIAPISAGKQGKQWLPLALLAMSLCFIPRSRVIGLASYPLLAISIFLLILLISPGVPRAIVPQINGARSWIRTPVMNIQPSEFAKIAFVLGLAWYLRFRQSHRTLLGLIVPFVMMLLPVALILKQPDLGTALMFAPALFAMLIAAGAKMRHLGGFVVIVAIGVIFNVSVVAAGDRAPDWMHVLKPHQEDRIRAMLWPERHARGEAFQQLTAMRLIGAGGLTGQGKERSAMLVYYSALPEGHNDMVYAVLINRWGLLGGVVVLGLYAILFISMLMIAARTRDPFARLSCVGFSGMLMAQSAINIAMNIGLMPITGITLPFISYGGSSLLSTFMMLGLTLNFATRRDLPMTRPSFEYDSSTQETGSARSGDAFLCSASPSL